MRRVLSILLVLFIAVGIGLILHRNPGVVVVSVAGWRVDMPLWLAVSGVILIYVTFYLVTAFIGWCFSGLHAIGDMASRYRLHRAKANTEAGFKALTLGEYHDASRLLHKGAPHSEFPWVNYLFAAKAAQAEKDFQERDACLAKASACLPKDDALIKMTACEFALQQGDWDKTLRLLQDLEKQLPRHPHVIALLKDVYLYQENWPMLRELLPKIKRAHILSRDEYEQLEATVCQGLIQQATKSDGDALPVLWKAMPSTLQSDPTIIKHYVAGLIEHNKMQQAEKVLHHALDKNWHEDLVKLYGQIEPVDPKKTLATLEKWLKSHMDSPNLLSQLGRLCDKCDLWEKAQRYYEASLRLAPAAETFAALGSHWEKLNRNDLGEAYIKKALEMSLPDVSNR